MGIEREQAEREQRRSLAADDWVTTMATSQLGESIHPEAYVKVGSLLNSQSLGQGPRPTSENFSQTPAMTTANASTLTVPPTPPAKRRIMTVVGVVVTLVVMLLGTRIFHLHRQNRVWEAENSALRAQITKLENARAGVGRSPGTFTTPPSCPGSQLIDTCWLKVGLGDCTKDVWEDPVKPLEDALRSVWDSTAEVFGAAWDSTSEVVGAVTDTVASDMRQVCDAMHSFGRFISEL